MTSQRTVITLVVMLGAYCIDAYPVYPESDSAQELTPMDFNLGDGAVGFMADSKPLAGPQPSRDLNQALPALREGASHDQKAAHTTGNKVTLQGDVPDHLVQDLGALLWKMVAVSELQSQGFTQTDKAPQQPNKRGCFWKYCVTK